MFPDCWDVQTFAGQYSDQLFAKCMFSWLSRNVYSLYILLREYGNPVIDQLILFVLRHWHCPMSRPLFYKLNCRKSFKYYFRFKENDKEELNNFRTLPSQILKLFFACKSLKACVSFSVSNSSGFLTSLSKGNLENALLGLGLIYRQGWRTKPSQHHLAH